MSKANEATARRWFETIWNQKRADLIEEFTTPDGVSHTESGDVHSADEFRQLHAQFISAFPDLLLTVEETVADDTNVVVRWRATGTHTGHGMGKPATGKPISFRGMTWIKFRDGKMAEGFDSWNLGGLMQRLE